jgi:predicted 3-demethylubiquinone-9 3-methyltransferase (glyoxalase superfamily)
MSFQAEGLLPTSPKIRTCLWFNADGFEAAKFYISLLPSNSYIESPKIVPDPSKPPLVVEFTLCGTPYMILNGGPSHVQTPAASIVVLTADQEETDRLWTALTENGGREDHCSWLQDKYGVSWQIVPQILPQLASSEDRAAAQRAITAMHGMKKIDIAALQKAYDNDES